MNEQENTLFWELLIILDRRLDLDEHFARMDIDEMQKDLGIWGDE